MRKPHSGRAWRSSVGAAGVCAVLVLAGCGTKTNTLAPASPQAKSIASLWWWVLGGCSFGLLFVTGLLVLAWVMRRRSTGPGREPGERAGWIVVLTLGVGVMVTGLVALFIVGDVVVARVTDAPAANKTAFTVRAVGKQWYWEFDYPGSHVVTAGEMHIPVRTPVLVQAASTDVIHDVWVPRLNRKVDAIPGVTNAIELYADRVGVYRGLCNQYCGLQHAHMGFLVFVEPPGKYRAWLAAQKRPAPATSGALAAHGKKIFLRESCSSCHTVRGTSAQGNTGPDLTHVGSRTTLAGVTIPNTAADMGRWITSSQSIKPGNQMPDVELGRTQLRALVAYLEGLR